MQTTAGQTKVVKISGNPNSTYSEGKCCSRSHVGLQVLYNPDRFQTKPLVRKSDTTKGRGVDFVNDFDEWEWADAIQLIADRLKATSPDRAAYPRGFEHYQQ